MRHILLAVLLFPCALLAQTTFAPIGARWTYTVHYAFMGDSAILNVESVGDTVILGRACHILSYDLSTSCVPNYRYVGASNDTVFFWEPVTSSFSTLFIANAVVGQQWTTTVSDEGFELSNTVTMTVTGTSNVMISGLPLRRLVLSSSPTLNFSVTPAPYLTERLGAAQYLFPWILSFCDGDFVTELRCYQDPDITWQDPEFSQCELGTGVAELSTRDLLSIPTTVQVGERLPITIGSGTTMHVDAFDASGRRLVDRTFQGSTALTFTSSGLHLLRFTDGRSRPIMRRVLVN